MMNSKRNDVEKNDLIEKAKKKKIIIFASFYQLVINLCLKCIYNNQDLLTVPVDHLLKTKKEFKNLMKQEIQAIFTKMNQIKHAFNMIWLMEILKI